MIEERLKLAIFIDFDNIQIGVKDTLGKEFDVALVLEALKERGEVVTKIAYGDWQRSGEHSRLMTQHAVQLVQRNVTPRGDKNGADINLALDALEMAFSRPHINAFAIVGGDSDFIALVEKLKQYDKRVFVVGGRSFTSNILQRNCHEFIAYENLLKSGDGGRTRSARSRGRAAASEGRPLNEASANIERALKILSDRQVAPQIGLLKSTLLQLDPTFSERDYGAGSFLEFVEKMARQNLVRLRKVNGTYLVETSEAPAPAESGGEEEATAATLAEAASSEASEEGVALRVEAFEVLKRAVAAASTRGPGRPLYLRQILQALRAIDKDFDVSQYGFRRLTDLLYEAQKDGWLRLQRGHGGVLRVFPSATLGAAEATSAEESATERAEDDALPHEGVRETPAPIEIVESLPRADVEPAPIEAAPVTEEAPPAKRPRRARGSRGGARRRGASRKKPEENKE